MYYIDALHLTNLAVEHGILKTHTQMDPQTGEEFTGILVFIEGKKEPELWDHDYMVRKLMEDSEGEQVLIESLAEKGVLFERYEGSASDQALKDACKTAPENIQLRTQRKYQLTS